ACRRWWISLQSYGTIKNHIQSRAAPQLDFLPTRQQHPSQADARADAGADPCAFPASVGESADRRAAARGYGNEAGGLSLGAALLDIVLTAIDFLRRLSGLDRGEPRRDAIRLSRRQSQRLQANAQFRASFHTTAVLGARHHALHVASVGHDDMAFGQDRAFGPQVHIVAFLRRTRV